jgi:creatinine amidohydrolase
LGALIADRASWPDIEAAIANGLIAVLPVGALEQHGAHLPLTTDTVLASGVARGVADATNALLLPAIAYGDAWTAEGWAGTLSLSPETLRAIITDLGRGLQRMGIKGLVTLNGHFGNREPIALAARTLSETGFRVLHLDYPKLESFAAEVCDSEPAGPGFYHADEVETSMMLALAPESVRLDRATPEYPEFPETFGLEPMKLSAFNRSGVFGDPRPATAEKGERLIAGIVEECVRLVGIWRVTL